MKQENTCNRFKLSLRPSVRANKIGFLAAVLILLAGFTLSAGGGDITIRYPNGGETIKTGSKATIKWQTRKPGGMVVIILYKKGIKHSVISKRAPTSGTFLWKVPFKLPAGRDYRIRIRKADNLAVNDFSDRNFSIK